MDIAEIGFAANTAELADAKAKLDALSPAAARAERATQKLNQMLLTGAKAATAAARADMEKANAVLSAAKASDVVTAADVKAAAAARLTAKATYDAARATQARVASSIASAAAANKEAAALQRMSAAAEDIPAVRSPMQANDNSANVMKANVGNIAAQFQDIGVTAAMGMNPLLIALQQGTQLSAVFATSGLGAVKAALLSVISPTALLTIGLVALVAAGIQMVDWVGFAQWGLNFMAEILPKVASGVALLGAAIAVAFAPAILSAFFTVLLTIAAGIVTAIGTIVAAVGAIPLAIGLIIADLYIFRDEWAQVLGFDLIDVVKKGVNLIIGSFVAAYDDIVFVWEQFPAVMGAAAIGAVNLAIRAINTLMKVTVGHLNKLIEGANSLMSLGGMVDGPQIGMMEAPQFDEFANQAANNLENAVATRNAKLQETLHKDYLGAMGDAVTSAATDAASKIKEFSASLGETGEAGKGKGGGTSEKFEDIVAGAERSIAAMQAERDAIGLSTEATARLKYETDLLNQAKQKNIDLTPEQRAQLGALAGDMANLEAETSRAKDALSFAKDATKGFVSDLVGGLRQGKSLWEAFGDAAMNVLNKLTDKLLNQVIDALFQVNNAASGSAGGGFMSGIGKFIAGIFGGGFAKGGAFSGGVQAFAKGGAFTNSVVNTATPFTFANGGAFGVMGEAGPEAIMPLKRGSDGSLGVQMHGNQTTSGNGQVIVQIVNNAEGTKVREENETGMDGQVFKRFVIETVSEGMANGTFDTAQNSRFGAKVTKVIR